MSETRDAGTSPPATSDAGSKTRDKSGKAAAERGIRPTAGAAKAGRKAIAAARSAAGHLTSAPAPAASTGADSTARVNRTLRRATLRVRHFSRRRALPRIRRLAALIASRLNPRNLERDYRRLLAGIHALLFDRAEEFLYFVPTRGHVAKSRLTIPSRVREEARDYRPTPVRLFRWAMSVLPEESLPDMTFVDCGAGRGRVLLMASHYPFEKIRGAEIAAELHDDCLMNVAQYP
ncbi:MAG: hypothetical protein D6773_07740, partial [Alphaproteobacteria bacterium]